jgi:hypothetical protein
VEMKFQLPPPLPEKRARRLGQGVNPAHEESPKRSSDSSEAATPVARENASALSIPAIQASASPSKIETGISRQKSKQLSTTQLVGGSIVAVSVIAVCLIIFGSWSRSAKSPAGDSNVALLDNTKYSTAAPSPAYVADSTASATPTVSVMRVSPPVNATPRATPTAPSANEPESDTDSLSEHTQEVVKTFVENFIVSGERNDPSVRSQFYAPVVKKFYEHQNFTRQQIAESDREYYRKWPARHYRPNPDTFRVSDMDKDFLVTGLFSWSVVKGSRVLKGISEIRLRIEFTSDDTMQIVEVDEQRQK